MVLVLHAVVLVLKVWFSVVKHGLVTLVVIMILNNAVAFQVLFIVSLFFAWNITTMEINSGVDLAYLKFKSAKCLCLLPVVLVLVLLFWSWSWSCKQRSWSCYFGLDLGIGNKNLVLFTSLDNGRRLSAARSLPSAVVLSGWS